MKIKLLISTFITYISQSKSRQAHQNFAEDEDYQQHWPQEGFYLVTDTVKEI